MSEKKNIAGIIEKVREFSNQLDAQEKEVLRDQLIAYLLFGNYNDQKNIERKKIVALSGLTEQERELIKKLAQQTEALYRAKHEDDQDSD
ncbi:MAG: hypothetical protein IPP71_08625 [Bacteroidetes bacterium]|nr:hypothetical protein [Bacteroidota bacterium]